MTFQPDKFQKSFIEAFEESLLNFQNDFLILTGDAGTGKTELILELIKISQEKSVAIEVTALTGRAAAVLSDRGVENPLTLHKWLNRISDPLLIQKYNNANAFVLVIDESSMISNGYEIFENSEDNEDLLLDKLMYIFYKHIPNDNKLIIFVGDEKQLPPVLHDYSPALDQLYLEGRYSLKGNTFVLGKAHRQADKKDINTFASYFEHSESALSKELAIPDKQYFLDNLDPEQVEFIDQSEVSEKFFFHYFDDSTSVKIITPTNQKADLYNYDIKKRLYSASKTYFSAFNISNNSLEVVRGDILQVFENNEDKFEKNIYNGQFLIVNDPLDAYDIVYHKGSKPDAFSRFPALYQKLNVSFVTDSGKKSNDNFEILVSVDYLIDSYHLNKEEFQYFNDKDSSVALKIRKNLNQKETPIYPGVSFDKKLNPILCKYGYALTGHKAQGGGWDYIFLDLENFWTDNGHVSPKWVYTSAKRTKKKLYLVNY